MVAISWLVSTKEDHPRFCIDNMLALWRVINAIINYLEYHYRLTNLSTAYDCRCFEVKLIVVSDSS